MEVIYMTRKVTVRVFLPVGTCSCSQTGFLGRVYKAVSKHRDKIDYREDSAGSDAAKKAGVKYRGVLVGTRLLRSNPTAAQIEEAILTEAKKQTE